MTYYFNPNMANGVLIDLDADVLITTRTLYSLSNWASEVGGFLKMVTLIMTALQPMLTFTTLEWFLVTSLFKQAPTTETETPSEQVSLRRKLMMMVENSLSKRRKFE